MADTQNKVTLNGATWIEVADNVDYTVQNIGVYDIRIKNSTLIPTDISGSLILRPDKVINQNVLSGRIWIIADDVQAFASIS